jgi:hypothetical protein
MKSKGRTKNKKQEERREIRGKGRMKERGFCVCVSLFSSKSKDTTR